MNRINSKVILSVICFSYLFLSLFQIISLSNKVAAYHAKNDHNDTLRAAYLDVKSKVKADISDKLQDQPRSSYDIIQATMKYVHENSLHLIDDEHKKYAFDIPVVLYKLFLASSGNTAEKPHLSCGPRSLAMMTILREFNIYSRLVQVYSDVSDTVEAHRLLEVLNPATQTWETWDPDYGVRYVDRENGTPVDIMTLVFSNRDNIIPIGLSAKGWVNTKTKHLKDNYFKAILFEVELEDGMGDADIIVINRSTFNMSKVFSSGYTFREWTKKVYGNPRLILLPGRATT